ncbi:MAG: bifunctional DNA-formamidopyrimidine glycosylase/DNA-(apurinic or apyrimidinic site) lyase [Candidatus Sungiibacteriota bacterium]
MPELAEVEITKRKLLPLVRNKTISGFWTDWPRGLKLARPDFVRRDIKKRKILDGHRTGKVIFLHLSGRPERMLAFHQRMSGRLEYSPRSYSNVLKNIGINKRAAVDGRRWTHFIFRFSDKSELRFTDPRKFGLVWYGSPEDFQKDKYLKNLGVDLKKLTFEEFREKLKTREQMIKAFLLRQDVISGIGNIIADESLWQARIHPKRKTSALSEKEIKNLFDALQKTVDEILKAGGTSMRNWLPPAGKKGGYQKLYKVYARVGEKCFRCGSKIKRIITAGRGTSFCLNCQS